jgi:CHAT domain-containing protein
MRIILIVIFTLLVVTEDAISREAETLGTMHSMPLGKAALIFERLGQEKLSVIMIRHDKLKRLDLDAPEATVESLADRLLNSLTPSLTAVTSPTDLPAFDAEAAHGLFLLLLQPLEAELNGINRLAIKADGTLALLPFGALLTALPTTQQRDRGDYASYPWLRQSFAISRLRKTTRPMEASNAISRAAGGLLGFGNPVTAEDVTHPSPPLPEANLELALLRMSLHGRPSTIAVGANASEARFKQALASSAPLAVLALATHGARLSGEQDGAVLMLTEGDGEDGLLTADDVRALRFRADLVILSACDSGAETLVDAFIEAGGDQVLALRWPVLSEVARRISTTLVAMTQTDTALDHDIALWRAVNRLIDGGNSSHFGHPMIWAPFVLTTATS